MAYIEMVHSFKRYHMGDITITANNDVSFGIERGELAIILGSSGAGKSTVLNILGGMDTNSEGKVIIDGVDISDFNAKQLTDYRRNNIGFVFQFYNLVANLTAKENVELASELVKNAADPVQTLVDVGLGGRGPAGHGASATGLGQRVGRLRTDATAGGTDATGSRTEPALRFMEPAGERQNAAGRGARTTRNKQNRARQSRRDARQMGTDRHHRQTLRTNTRQIRHGDQPVQRSLRRIQLNAYNAGLQQYQNAVARLDQGSQAYRSNADNLAQASKQIAEKQNELGKAVSQAGKQVADGVTQLIQGQRDIDKAETEYQSKLAEFNAQKPEAERKISEAERKISEAERQITLAEEKIDNLTVPAYSVSGRREGLTSQGYRVYMVIEGIVAKLADIFLIFLYFVAAHVTFSTMGRMVDEERTNSGTLKALGYGNADVMLKFTVYGFAASTLGTCIGVLAGHTLLPLIVAHAYSAGFTMPDIMLKFHPWITMAAFALAWISAVVPAWLAASKELREKPASLLLPKPPAKGSKILLEHFPPLWNRLNFTHKVTARNIFRYKTRMFMTVFGVCGAVSLLTAGLAVQSSIGQIGNRQFEGLIHYDLIVAEESDTNSAQREEIATTLKGKTVQSSTAVRYEELSKTAGKENDKQSITLLATDGAYNFNEYLTLRDRKTRQPQILVNNGAVISERLAEMLNVSVGDTFTVNDENGAQRTIKVAGISEMYIGHFIFMNAQCYEHVFGDQYNTNAYMVRLKDHSNANTERQGAKFMKLAAVRGVVQNTTQKNMVSTIVGSLNQIMEVLILVAVLLAVVILYNLTNLNVSERIRELSTIKVLGFHTSETTMYIYRETILLSLLGILAGYGFGEWLHRYIITEVPPDEVMFDPAISWIALAAPAIVVAVALAVLGWIVYRQLETVDMLEALKSVE